MKKITPRLRNLLFILIIVGSTLNLNATDFSNLKIGDNSDMLYGNELSVPTTHHKSFEERLSSKLNLYSLKNDFSKRISIIFTEAKLSSSIISLYGPFTISIGSNPMVTVCGGITNGQLPYTNASTNTNKFSLLYSTAAKSQGFIDIPSPGQALSGGSSGNIPIVIPANASPGTYDVSLFVHNTNSAKSDAYPFKVIIKASSTIDNPSNKSQVVCINTALSDISFYIGGTGTGATVTGLPNGVSGVFNNGVFKISGTPVTAGTFNYNVKATGDCTLQSQSGTITVNPLPSVNKPSDIVACNNGQISAINFTGSTVGGTTYSWTNTNTSIGLGASGNGNIAAFTSKNTTNTPITADITVTPKANNCNGTSQTFKITVNPTSTVTKPADIVVCNNEQVSAINFTGSAVNGTNYSWTNTNTAIGLGASGNGNIAAFNAKNTTNAPITADITITPKANNCNGTSQTFKITVNPTSTVTKPADIVVCNNEQVSAINFTGSAVNGTNYSWTNTNTAIGLGASGNGNISAFNAKNTTNAPITANITITPKANNCNGTPQTFKITVNPTSSVTKPADLVVCNNEQVSAINFTGSAVNGTNYSWTNTNTAIGLVASGNGNISAFTAKNTTNAAITADITVIPNANDCNGTPQTFKITVNPQAAFTKPNDIVICAEEQINAIDFIGATVQNTTYTWSNDNPNIGLSSSGSGNIASFKAKNTTAEILVAQIIVTPTANGCAGTPQTFSITVNPTPTITKPADIIICAGETIDKITFPAASVTGTSKKWINDNTSIGLGANGNGNINAFTAVNNTTDIIVANITVIPSANNCEGIPVTFKISVKPFPSVVAPENQSYCNGIATDPITLTGTPIGTKYNITGGASIGLNNKTEVSEIPSFTALKGSATITITPVVNGCTGNSVSYTVLVNPTPTVSISPTNQEICTLGTTSLNLTGGISGSTFEWTVAQITPAGSITGASDGTGNKIEQTLTNTTNSQATIKYTVVPKANACSGTPISVSVKVNPTPILELTIPECEESIDLTSPIIKTGSTSSGLTYSYWTNSDATTSLPNPNNVGKGTYYIKGTSSSGCSVIKEVVVSKLKPIITNLNTAPKQVCSGSNVDFTPVSNLENTSITWSRAAIGGNPTNQSDDKNIENPNETLINTGTSTLTAKYVFKLETDTGCITTKEINIDILPEPQLVSNPIGDHCNGEQISHTLQSNLSGTTISWSRAEFLNNPAKTGSGNINEILYNDSGNTVGVTYSISLTSSDGCMSETQISFSLLSGPKVTATASATEICPGGSVNLTSTFEGEASLPTVLINENFSGSASNWSKVNNSNGGNNAVPAWTLRPNNYNPPNQNNYTIRSDDNSQFYFSNSDNQGRGTYTETILKYKNPISTIGYSTLNLSFWQRYEHYSSKGEVQVSTNNSNWQTVYTISGTDTGIQNINLNGYAGKNNIYIRFKYTANWGYWWALDNIKLEGTTDVPTVTWTSSSDPDWTSNEQNPENISPSETTIYTATYSDPDINCPGISQVEVIVRTPPEVTITPNYCGDSKFIELFSDNEFATYRWESAGEIIGTERSVGVELARTYTLTVTDDFGCIGTGSINVSDELLTNGDFETGTNGFFTDYRNVTGTAQSLYPEGYYAVDRDARFYHNNFYGKDHTTGNGKFMIINGHPGSGKVIWRQTINNIQPNTNYYFSAWGMNLNPGNPARLQFQVNGVPTGTVANLNNAPKPTSQNQVNTNNWIQFYSNPFWNSGNATTAVLEIINLETIRSGNDFGLDDISFGTLEPIIFSIDPSNDSPICSGGNLQLFANIDGGRDPIKFSWTNAEGVEVSTEENPLLEGVTTEDSGIYTLKVTDGYGCNPQIGTTDVTIIPETVVNAGEDIAVCSESPEVQLSGIVSGSIQTGFWQKENGDSSGFANSSVLETMFTPTQAEIDAGNLILVLTSNNPDAPCEPVTDSLTITFNPTPIIDTVEFTNVTCYQANNGIAKAIVSSGTAPYTFLWSDGQETQTATSLAPGDYSVIVTDSFGCQIEDTITIQEPNAISIINTSFTPVQCFGGSDGTASIEISGGFLPDAELNYIFTLLDNTGLEVFKEENNSTGKTTVENLMAGVYTFTATTVNSCATLTENVIITQPEEISVNAGDDVTISDCGVTRITLAANATNPEIGKGVWTIISPADGGNGSFTDASSNNSGFNGLPNTSYVLNWTITPTNGCTPISDEIAVTLPPSCSKLDFDGVDDYLDFGDNFKLRGGSFTIEAWVKPHAINGIQTIISKRDESDLTLGGYDLILDNGNPSIRINNKTIIASQKVSNTRWYHIAAIFDGTNISLYVDGIKLKTDALNQPKIVAAPMLIGAMYNSNSPLTPKNYFHGWIEEVRVWSTALTEEQLHFMMNQRLEINSNPVKGFDLPIDVPGSLQWTSLEGYYQLLVGEVTDGITKDKSNSKIDGELKNIQTNQENTAPLPYESEAYGNWKDKNTWDRNVGKTGNKYWSWPNDIGINGEDINWNIAKISNDLKSGGHDITVLGLISLDKTLVMKSPSNSQDENNTGQGLTITHYLKLNGIIDLEGESQLVQTGIGYFGQTVASDLDKNSSGYVERDQQGTANSFNYNYWSSPVSLQNAAINSGYTISGVMWDGTNSDNPIPMSFVNGAYGADDDAVNITTYWLYKFRGTANIYSEWKFIGKNGALLSGEGYTMKGTSGKAAITDRQNYTFRGLPNNGNISLSIGKNQNYLLGNPYPSAMDANQFIKDNLKSKDLGGVLGGSSNTNIFNGALYFWDHFAGKTHNLAEYIGGYATYNLSGGVPAVATDARINNTGESSEHYFGNNARIPQQYIPVAQGFFVNTVLDPAVSGNITVDGGNVIFNNGQRAFVRESKSNSQFLRQDKPKTKGKDKDTDSRSKIRLVYESPLGFNRQILVTADENATNDFDLGYDALLNDNNPEDMYWVIKEHEFVIQGVPHFNKDQELALGVKLKEKGEITIKINSLENIQDDVKIYIRDAVDSTYHDLRKADFVTTIEGGTFNSKYSIVFQKPTDSTPDTDGEAGTDPNEGTDEETDGEIDETPKPIVIDVIYSMDERMLRVLNPSEIMIEKIELYNMLGQQLQVFSPMSTTNSVNVHLKEFPKATYIVKVKSIRGTVSKTILFQK